MEHDPERDTGVCMWLCVHKWTASGIIANQTVALAFPPPRYCTAPLCCLSMTGTHRSPVTACWHRGLEWNVTRSKVFPTESLMQFPLMLQCWQKEMRSDWRGKEDEKCALGRRIFLNLKESTVGFWCRGRWRAGGERGGGGGHVYL